MNDVVRAKRSVIRVLDGEALASPPVWMMRQAGRYLPEYRDLRKQAGTFLDLCFTPTMACEVTLQPIRRFGFDAAILFSDILVVPFGLGQEVWFEEGIGPRLVPVDLDDLIGLRFDEMIDRLDPVMQAIGLIRQELPVETTLLGFCGAPWTVATYMIAGQGTADQGPARLAALHKRDQFVDLIDRLVEASIAYLVAQFKAGVDAVQIFDSWAGILTPADFQDFCVGPTKRIVEGVREQVEAARIIGFPKGASLNLPGFVEQTRVNAVGIDWTIPVEWAAANLQKMCAVQGNLDPMQLIGGGVGLDRSVDGILERLGGGPFIFNLGHGITPATPVENVSRMVERVRAYGGGKTV